jgi:predicted O-methyltransferase YrrM
MGTEVEALYVMVRLVKPEVIVETGVGAGITSTYILKALDLNQKGMLFSIDLPDETDLSGWAIPNELKSRWRLYKGSSIDLLPAVLNDTGPIDIFLHDSNHSYEHMTFEFRTIWPYLKKGGIFLAHDVGRNDALFDFCDEVRIPWTKVRTFPVLGGFRKA